MRRFAFLLLLLALACAAAVSAATIPPLAATIDLEERAVTNLRNHPGFKFYRCDDRKPDGLQIELPIAEKMFYHEFRLGPMETSRYLVYGKDKGEYIDFMYFDLNGDNIITEDENVPVCYYSSKESDGAKIWLTEPLRPLVIPVDYRWSDGSTYTRDLTMAVSFLTIQSSSSRSTSTVHGISVLTNIWFVGEIPADGDRLLKVAVVDLNGDGVFNDDGRDALLIDKNYDSVFDWKKELLILGKTWRGLNQAGKRASLIPAVAAWPQKLSLAPKGAAVELSQLESR